MQALGGRARSGCKRAGPAREHWARRTGRSAASEREWTSMPGAGPVGSLSMRGARRVWWARHERPETARWSALTIPTAPIAHIRQRHALAASTVRGARPLPTGPVRQDGTTPACWEAGVIPSGTIKQSRLCICTPRGASEPCAVAVISRRLARAPRSVCAGRSCERGDWGHPLVSQAGRLRRCFDPRVALLHPIPHTLQLRSYVGATVQCDRRALTAATEAVPDRWRSGIWGRVQRWRSSATC